MAFFFLRILFLQILGSFSFAWLFLISDPLLEGDSLTDTCKTEYGLTTRETVLIERMLDGSTNQELADAVCIFKKL